MVELSLFKWTQCKKGMIQSAVNYSRISYILTNTIINIKIIKRMPKLSVLKWF